MVCGSNGFSQIVNRSCTCGMTVPARQRAGHEQQDPDHQPRLALGRDVEHGDEQAEEQGRRADVGLEDQDQQADRPERQDRAEVAGPRQVDPDEPPAGQGQHVPLGDQVAGEEDGERDPGEFTGLDREAAQDDPDLGPVDGAEAGRQQRGDGQQDQADRAQGVGIPLQDSRLADHDQDGDERGDADRRPHQLVQGGVAGQRGDRQARVAAAAGFLQPVDHHDADAVEHRRERQQERVGPRREFADGQVGDGHQHREPDHVGHEPGRNVPVQAKAGRDVRERHDERPRSRASPVPDPAGHGAALPRGWPCRWPGTQPCSWPRSSGGPVAVAQYRGSTGRGG